MKRIDLETVENKIAEVKAEKEQIAQNKLEVIEQNTAAIENLIKEKIQAELPRIKEEATTEIVGTKLKELDSQLNTVSLVLNTLESLIIEDENVDVE